MACENYFMIREKSTFPEKEEKGAVHIFPPTPLDTWTCTRHHTVQNPPSFQEARVYHFLTCHFPLDRYIYSGRIVSHLYLQITAIVGCRWTRGFLDQTISFPPQPICSIYWLTRNENRNSRKKKKKERNEATNVRKIKGMMVIVSAKCQKAIPAFKVEAKTLNKVQQIREFLL